MDAQLLKNNFAQIAEHGEEIPEFFYADLFERNPQLRGLFPASMERQHKLLLDALGHIVSMVDNPSELVPFLQTLGREHKNFGVVPDHYPEVGTSLIATLRYFSGDTWSTELENDWGAAYGVVAQVMVEAG